MEKISRESQKSAGFTHSAPAYKLRPIGRQPRLARGRIVSRQRCAIARVELERLLTLSSERYVSPYNIAMIYHGLGEREATFARFVGFASRA